MVSALRELINTFQCEVWRGQGTDPEHRVYGMLLLLVSRLGIQTKIAMAFPREERQSVDECKYHTRDFSLRGSVSIKGE